MQRAARWLRASLLASLLASMPASLPASARAVAGPRPGPITVVDATPAFWSFWEAAGQLPEDERAAQFLARVVEAHPELFSAGVLHGNALYGPDASKDAHAIAARYLADVVPYLPRMRSISESVHRDFDDYARDFALAFPDFAPASPVYFTISLFDFDGGTRPVAGRMSLLFGIDGIARFHGEHESLRVLFDHELFHLYHDQVAPELAADDVPLWVSMWEEGLATYVSGRMSPGSSEAQVLMSETLAERSRAMLPALARELLANFASTDAKEYAAFFYGSNGRPDLPPRCGYFLGLQVAKRLGAGRPLRQLARLRGPALERAVRQALAGMAGGT